MESTSAFRISGRPRSSALNAVLVAEKVLFGASAVH
jgi:hypothetical protein